MSTAAALASVAAQRDALLAAQKETVVPAKCLLITDGKTDTNILTKKCRFPVFLVSQMQIDRPVIDG